MARPDSTRRRGSLPLLLALAATGCTQLDSGLATIHFLSFMQKSPAPGPYGMPRPSPPGSIPYQSPAGGLFPGLQPTDSSLRAFGAAHHNPVPVTNAVAARAGQALFNRFCFVCHGPLGKGNGPILNRPQSNNPAERSGKFPFAPNLTLSGTVALSDGYLFGIVSVGRGFMPEFGSKIPAPERWYVVNYVRELQRAAGSAAPPGSTAPGGASPRTASAVAPASTMAPAKLTGAPAR